jgi:hypothetical protein
MNKHISCLLHSALMVGALLPISPLASFLSPLQPNSSLPARSFTQVSVVNNVINNSLPTGQQAYQPDVQIVDGRGLPKFRDGGGTR